MGGKLSSLKCQVLPPQNLSKKTQEPLPGMFSCYCAQHFSQKVQEKFFLVKLRQMPQEEAVTQLVPSFLHLYLENGAFDNADSKEIKMIFFEF
jgi:hypothetical protein